MNQSYAPPPHGTAWATVAPADAGFDATRLQAAVDYAKVAESPWPRSFYYPDGRYVGIVEWNETGPWSEIVGPVKSREGPAGLILKGGRIVAEWGDTARTDMTFSIAKSYLAVLAGLAVADGLIKSIDEPVGATVKGPSLRERPQRAASPGAISCSNRASGRASSGASPTRSITTASSASAPTTAARATPAS